MIRLILSERRANVFTAIGGVFVLCILIRTVIYCRARTDPVDDAELDSRLENSLEFLAGLTALLFLGLEGLALDGHNNCREGGQQQHLALPLGVSFVACVFGVLLTLVETIPPLPDAAGNGDVYAFLMSNYTVIFDFVMAFAISAVMWSIMHAIVELRALLLLLPLFLILLVRAYDVVVGGGVGGGGGGGNDEKPASLELAKVTFTGFLAVSIPAVRTGSLCSSTDWFLIFAASAIVSGFAWRLLTHAKMGTTANFASFCTHFCIAIAAVPFTVMAVKALH